MGKELAGIGTVLTGSAEGGSGGSVPRGATTLRMPGSLVPHMDVPGLGVSSLLGRRAVMHQVTPLEECIMGQGWFWEKVPGKLVEHIQKWEFRGDVQTFARAISKPQGKRGIDSQAEGGVQDINVWLQCFAMFVGMMAKTSQEAVPGLIAYMSRMIQASQEYDGSPMMWPSGGKQQQLVLEIGAGLTHLCIPYTYFTGKA